MNKYIFLALSASILGLSSCSDDKLDAVNVNNSDPSGSLVSANLQISDAIMSTAFTTVSGDYAFYTSTLTEQLFGTGNNQLMKAELRNAGELAAPSTFNNVWNGTYANLLNIKEMIEKVENNIASSGSMIDVLGEAQVLWAINFGVLTDMHGDIPYSEALQGAANMQAKPDAQKDVYADIIATLNKAIANLSAAVDDDLNNAGSVDIAYGGDPEKWLAAAYAVKARCFIHQTAVTPNAVDSAYAAALEAKALGFDGLLVTEFNGVTCDNPWSAFVWSREYNAPNQTVTDMMTALNDPRIIAYCYGEDPDDVAAPAGDADAAHESSAWIYPMYYDLGSQPVHIMSAHELYFILAEAELRLGMDATADFATAVQLSVDEIDSWDCPVLTDGATYAASLGTPDLKALFEQKYLAMVVDEQVETYNDLRRCMAMNESYITLNNPMNTQAGLNRWPYMLPYGQSSLVSNPGLAAIAGDGTYIYTKQSWVNGGK